MEYGEAAKAALEALGTFHRMATKAEIHSAGKPVFPKLEAIAADVILGFAPAPAQRGYMEVDSMSYNIETIQYEVERVQ